MKRSGAIGRATSLAWTTVTLVCAAIAVAALVWLEHLPAWWVLVPTGQPCCRSLMLCSRLRTAAEMSLEAQERSRVAASGNRSQPAGDHAAAR